MGIPRNAYVLGSLMLALLIGGGAFFFRHSLPFASRTGIAVEETLRIPETERIDGHAGRTVTPGAYDAPLDAKSGEGIVSSRAVHTLKGSYAVANVRSLAWADDAALISIQSLGAVTEEGKSGEWQLFFGSASRGAGFEVIVFGDRVASEKEVASVLEGYPVPVEWYDSGDALASLRDMPQFSDATVSSLHFFHNEDGERWGYALSTSEGTVSMPVR